MKNKDNQSRLATEPRSQTEKIALENAARSSENFEALSPEEIRKTFHELRLHQIELKMQNEELRRTQTELDTARARYFDLYDLAPVGYCAVNEKGLIQEANLTAAILLGVTRSELIKQPMGQFILKEDQDAYYLHRKQLFETGERNSIELRMVKTDGTQFWAHLEMIDLHTANGTIESRIVVSDITDRKRVEEALLESESRMRLLVEGTPYLFFYTQDREALISYISPSVEKITGHSVDEWHHQKHWFITDNIINEYAKERTRAHLRGEVSTASIFVEVEHADKHPILLEIFESPIFNNGKVVGLQGVAHDVTERKHSEEALRSLLVEKDILLREVHHRVKNNLASIIALLDLQRKALGDSSMTNTLSELGMRIKSMALIHEQLYRSENISRIDCQEYLGALISSIGSSLKPSNDFRISIHASGVTMGLDTAIPIGMMVNELAMNSMKYAFPKGKPRHGQKECELNVSLEQNGETCTLIVADNGVGMREDIDWETTTTLGLRLVRALGEHQLGGTISYDGSLGTRFILTFQPKEQRTPQ